MGLLGSIGNDPCSSLARVPPASMRLGLPRRGGLKSFWLIGLVTNINNDDHNHSSNLNSSVEFPTGVLSCIVKLSTVFNGEEPNSKFRPTNAKCYSVNESVITTLSSRHNSFQRFPGKAAIASHFDHHFDARLNLRQGAQIFQFVTSQDVAFNQPDGYALHLRG